MICREQACIPKLQSHQEALLEQAKRGTGGNWIGYCDCREQMRSLPSHVFSLILTDPPYFIDGMDDRWNHSGLRARVRKGVIGGLPVGMKFDIKQGKRLYEFLRPIAEQWLRLVKPGGFVLCFAQPRLAHRTAAALEDAGFEIRDLLAWRYEGQAKAFKQAHFIRQRKGLSEHSRRLMIKSLGERKTPQLKPQMEVIVLAQAPREGTFADNWLKHRAGLIDAGDPLLDAGRFPGTVMSVPKPRERFGHLTAKPVDLLRHLIRIFCAQASPSFEPIVFDPFAGSGSTGVAARLEGRSFWGCELDPVMGKIAEKRISCAQKLMLKGKLRKRLAGMLDPEGLETACAEAGLVRWKRLDMLGANIPAGGFNASWLVVQFGSRRRLGAEA